MIDVVQMSFAPCWLPPKTKNSTLFIGHASVFIQKLTLSLFRIHAHTSPPSVFSQFSNFWFDDEHWYAWVHFRLNCPIHSGNSKVIHTLCTIHFLLDGWTGCLLFIIGVLVRDFRFCTIRTNIHSGLWCKQPWIELGLCHAKRTFYKI